MVAPGQLGDRDDLSTETHGGDERPQVTAIEPAALRVGEQVHPDRGEQQGEEGPRAGPLAHGGKRDRRCQHGGHADDERRTGRGRVHEPDRLRRESHAEHRRQDRAGHQLSPRERRGEGSERR